MTDFLLLQVVISFSIIKGLVLDDVVNPGTNTFFLFVPVISNDSL